MADFFFSNLQELDDQGRASTISQDSRESQGIQRIPSQRAKEWLRTVENLKESFHFLRVARKNHGRVLKKQPNHPINKLYKKSIRGKGRGREGERERMRERVGGKEYEKKSIRWSLITVVIFAPADLHYLVVLVNPLKMSAAHPPLITANLWMSQPISRWVRLFTGRW